MLARDCETGDLAFDERQFEAADSSRLTSAIHVRDAGLLKLIDTHAAVFNHTSQQLRQLYIRHKMITACEIIAGYFPAARQRHAFKLLSAVRGDDPASAQIPNTSQLPLQAKRLRSPANKADREFCELH